MGFLRFLTTRPGPLDPDVRYPPRVSLYVLVSLGIIILEWFYFYAQVPYDTIPNKPVFWFSLIAWALPPILVEWAYLNAPTKRKANAYFNMMILVGVVGLGVVISMAKGNDALVPVVAAAVPGLMAGGLIGSDSTLFWRLHKDGRQSPRC